MSASARTRSMPGFDYIMNAHSLVYAALRSLDRQVATKLSSIGLTNERGDGDSRGDSDSVYSNF